MGNTTTNQNQATKSQNNKHCTEQKLPERGPTDYLKGLVCLA